jgi:hypothetical protein
VVCLPFEGGLGNYDKKISPIISENNHPNLCTSKKQLGSIFADCSIAHKCSFGTVIYSLLGVGRGLWTSAFRESDRKRALREIAPASLSGVH